MSIKNEMEQLVREEVRRARQSGVQKKEACWCPLCETDVVALSLTLLPPLYCRAETYGHAASLIGPPPAHDQLAGFTVGGARGMGGDSLR